MARLSIYSVPVQVQGIQHHRVQADGPEQAVSVILMAGQSIVNNNDVVDRKFIAIAGPAVAEPEELPDIAVLMVKGTLIDAREGRREYLFEGKNYVATWVTISGSLAPGWAVTCRDAYLLSAAG